MDSKIQNIVSTSEYRISEYKSTHWPHIVELTANSN